GKRLSPAIRLRLAEGPDADVRQHPTPLHRSRRAGDVVPHGRARKKRHDDADGTAPRARTRGAITSCGHDRILTVARPRAVARGLNPAGLRTPKPLAVIRDVTEPRAREHQYRDLIDGSSNGLCIYSDYVIRYANRAVAQMLGHAKASDLVGRDIRDILPDCPG